MQTYTKESLIVALQAISDRGWIATDRGNNDGNVGNVLEDLLGIEENNLPIPNAAEWELKAQRKRTSSLVTLFHLEPSPTALKFVPSILLPNYGWSHDKAGTIYPNSEMSFRQTIRCGLYSSRGFTVVVNRAEQRIEVIFDATKVDQIKNGAWVDKIIQDGNSSLNPNPYWGFNDFYHKLGSKLHNCFYVIADHKTEKGLGYFKYEEVYMLKELTLEKMLAAFEQGLIYVDFDARTRHNHGTKFRIKRTDIMGLYGSCTRII